MAYLGALVWWSVGSPNIDGRALPALLASVGIDVPPPRPIVPADAFRRLTGDSKRSYSINPGERITLDLQPAQSQKTMLVRHIVRTVKADKVTISADRVGECAFYKPPKGAPQRARIRITPYPSGAPDTEQIEQFCDELRQEYERALRYLDPQAIRRLVRQYLTNVNAIFLGGTYFVPDEDDAMRLCELLDALGGGSKCWTTPVVDDAERRAMVTAGIEAAASEGDAPDALLQAYLPLGLVPKHLEVLLR